MKLHAREGHYIDIQRFIDNCEGVNWRVFIVETSQLATSTYGLACVGLLDRLVWL